MYQILTDRAVVEVSGEDTIKFLQNLTTNDITKADYCYTYMLNNQGRYLFDFFIFIASPIKVIIDININNILAFFSHLNLYKLRAKIEIKDLTNVYQVIYTHQKCLLEFVMSKQDPRHKSLGIRSIVKKDTYDEKYNSLYITDKYNFAIIDGYEDLISAKSVPIEYGANELNAISYDKGCYIGQEIISRAKYQGVIRKTIFKISADQDISFLLKGEEIFAREDKIGSICSAYKNQAIALIRTEEYLARREWDITIKGIKVSVSNPDWREL